MRDALLTAAGMALVVYVFATVLLMSEGIRATLVATGRADNVIVLRKGAGAEINSGITRAQATIVETLHASRATCTAARSSARSPWC